MKKVLMLIVGMLGSAGLVRAEVFTVGPTGTYATLQAGFDAAAVVPGSHEVRVASGVHHHGFQRLDDRIANTIEVSGGWNATFDSPYLTGPTILDADGSTKAITSRLSHGARVALRFLTIRDGLLDPDPSEFVIGAFGAGLDATVSGVSELELSHLVVVGNRINIRTPGCTAAGGGTSIDAFDQARVRVLESLFEGNRITEAGASGPRRGGGLSIRVTGAAHVEVRRNTFLRNGASGTGEVGAGGLHLLTQATARPVTVQDNRFEENVVAAVIPTDTTGAGMTVDARGAGAVVARRNQFVRNSGSAQLRLVALGGGAIAASDSLLHVGPAGGMTARGAIALSNLTVTHNGGTGIDVAGGASVVNTIAFGNGTDLLLGSGSFAASNLVGVDPLFEPGSLYRIQAGSPARDAGTNAPPGGLGPRDLDLEARLVGPSVDIGAHEHRP